MHDLALGMPHVTVGHGPGGNPVYQVGRKSFVFLRTPRADATDPETGERMSDVIVFWVTSESEKQALVQDASPFFTTAHFDGHCSVLLQAGRIGELTRQELAEVVQAPFGPSVGPADCGWLSGEVRWMIAGCRMLIWCARRSRIRRSSGVRRCT